MNKSADKIADVKLTPTPKPIGYDFTGWYDKRGKYIENDILSDNAPESAYSGLEGILAEEVVEWIENQNNCSCGD
jgi:hypothetical protein